MISPHTGYLTHLQGRPAAAYAAAPGPYWADPMGGNATAPHLPDAPVPHSALYPVRGDGTADMLLARAVGTYSSVPELLPFDDLLVIRAKAFHADDVTFEVSAGAGVGLPQDGALAYVNGTSVPVEIARATGIPGAVARASVSVSEVAWRSGILIRGITDEHAAPDSIVRDLHEVTLVAEMPVDAMGGRDYARLDPSRSVEPWGCWPREGGWPMRVGARDAWPAEPREGARMVAAGPAREHVAMGEPIDEHMEAAASPETTFVDIRAPEGWGAGTAISARVTDSSPWPPSPGAAGAPGIDVANRGDGTAMLAVDRSSPGEHTIEVTATGPEGTATEAHTLRIPPSPRVEAPAPNLEPEAIVLLDGEPVVFDIDLVASLEPAELELRAVDPEGDRVRFLVRTAESSYGARAASLVRLDDRGDGTASLRIDRGEPGEIVLDIAAADVHGEEWGIYLVRIAPVQGAALFMDGSPVGPPLVELRASHGEALFVAHAGQDGGEPSVRVLRSSPWGAGGAAEPPRVEARGGGEAAVWVDASATGEHLVEVADAGGAALYVIRVLPARAGGGEGAAREGGAPPASPEGVIGKEAQGPRTEVTGGGEKGPDAREGPPRGGGGGEKPGPDAPWGGDGARQPPPHARDRLPLCADAQHAGAGSPALRTMSGVPPIDGVGYDRDARAVFGRQVTQWVYLDTVEDPSRERYYVQEEPVGLGNPALAHLKNPYTNKTETFGYQQWHPRAAAPGPYWDDRTGAIGFGRISLHFAVNGTVRSITASVNATNSLVPELLPMSGTVEILATAFHDDVATFSVMGEVDPLWIDYPELEPPHGATHATVNGTAVPLGDGLSATVRVSDIARQNRVLIEGITDGGGAAGMEVKRLHEVTLAAEIPFDAGDIGAYDLVGDGRSVAPWGCWPREGGEALAP